MVKNFGSKKEPVKRMLAFQKRLCSVDLVTAFAGRTNTNIGCISDSISNSRGSSPLETYEYNSE
jgi:hypothetical protein